MHRTALVLVLVFAAGAFVARREAGEGGSHFALEQVRLRAHFDSVLVELGASDVAHLTANQRAARSELTIFLAEYRDAGRFPLNDRHSDRPTPIFRDARGVTCAMAYLIERSGRGDIVDRFERSKNLAYVSELGADRDLVAWLDSVGLSVEEGSRVQPTYPPNPDEIVDKSYARWSLWLNGASIATATWNLARPSDGVGVLGVLVGALTVLHSAAGSDQLGSAQRRDKSIDSFSRVTGASAIIAGLWAINRKPRSGAAKRVSRVEVIPVVGVPLGSQQFAVVLTARF